MQLTRWLFGCVPGVLGTDNHQNYVIWSAYVPHNNLIRTFDPALSLTIQRTLRNQHTTVIMETITNIASTAATTASKLIYGDTTAKNETAGKEPLSGEQGKGTVAEPFDKGNEGEHSYDASIVRQADTPAEDATAAAASLSDAKIEPTHNVEPTGSVKKPEDLLEAYDDASGPKTTTAKIEPTHTVEPTGSVKKPEDLLEAYDSAPGSKTTTEPQATAVTDKLWKPTDVDAVKPSVVDPTAAPETGMGSQTGEKSDLWRPTEVYQGSVPAQTDGTVSPMDTSAPSSSIAAVSGNNNLDAYKIESNTDKVSSDQATSDIKKLDSH
jgi:hypothetical protein